jgi:diguanylate cyclase (GGDEF)-like protein
VSALGVSARDTWDEQQGPEVRSRLVDDIARRLCHLRDDSLAVAVIVVDVSRTRIVAEYLGLEGGDAFVEAVERRLRAACRSSDDVVRSAFEQVCVVLDGVTREDAERVAWRYIEVTSGPAPLAGKEVTLDASVGIALTRDPVARAEQLLRVAETEARRATERGPAIVEISDDARLRAARAELDLVGELRRALSRDELEVVYQPVVSTKDGAIRSVEALVRWRHPDRGMVLPGEFIPVAERSGLIGRLGEWVLRSACRQVAEWRSELEREQARLPGDAVRLDLGLSVNVSAGQLDRPDVASVVDAALKESGLEPSALCLEITESVPLERDGAVVSALHEICNLGVKLAIDDFLTGYSSLEMLRDMPVHQLKIDRSFVAGMNGARDGAIVKATVELAHALGVEVVAEGVEHAHQLELLRELGCDLAQGWLFSHPLNSGQAADVLLPVANRWSRGSLAPSSETLEAVAAALDAGKVAVAFSPVEDLDLREVVGFSVCSSIELAGGTISHAEVRDAARNLGRLATLDWACATEALGAALDAELHPNLALLVPFDPSTLLTPCPAEAVPVLQRALDRLRVVATFSARGVAEESPLLLGAVELAREIGWGVGLNGAAARPDALALLPLARPDIVSLDLNHPHCTHQGIAAASVDLRAYCERHGAAILVEGVLGADDALRARAAGATFGQGAHFGPPGDLPRRAGMPKSVISFLTPIDLATTPSPFPLVTEKTRATVIEKALLLEIADYLEDRAASLGESTLALVVMQRELSFDERTRERLAGLAKRCPATMVLGPAGCASDERFAGAEIAADDPIGLEWDVIVLGPDYSVALVAQDLGDSGPDGKRRFAHALTHDRELVRFAARAVLKRLSGRPVAVARES